MVQSWNLQLVKGTLVRYYLNVIQTVRSFQPIWYSGMISLGAALWGGVDFLTESYPSKFDNVITNPPFSLAKEFAERALEISREKVILFAKIQFLEGQQRKDFFAAHPPRSVYVFSKRVNPLRNGIEVDENGKPWSSTMCFAWFVWEHGFTGEPGIRWL